MHFSKFKHRRVTTISMHLKISTYLPLLSFALLYTDLSHVQDINKKQNKQANKQTNNDKKSKNNHSDTTTHLNIAQMFINQSKQQQKQNKTKQTTTKNPTKQTNTPPPPKKKPTPKQWLISRYQSWFFTLSQSRAPDQNGVSRHI